MYGFHCHLIQVNPPKFDMSEDMADLTFLGDACVLWNSVVRYEALGKDPATKSDKFLENPERPLTPSPHFCKIILQIFYNGYGCIYARRHSIS